MQQTTRSSRRSTRTASLCVVLLLPTIACDEGEAPAPRAASRTDPELDVAAIAALPSVPAKGAIREVPTRRAAALDLDLVADDRPQAWPTTGWVSNEDPPASCRNDEIAIGFGCGDTNCDDMALECAVMGGTIDYGFWSEWISEESPNNVHLCPFDQYVTDVVCTGKNCDKVAVQCTSTSYDKNGCFWGEYVDPPTNVALTYSAPEGFGIAGIQCAGSYCDRVRAWVCELS